MTLIARLALLVLGAALVAALWIGGRTITERPADRQNRRTAAVPHPASGEAEQDSGAVSEAHPVRRIAPDSIAPPEPGGALLRVAPRAPLTAATKPLKRETFGPPLPRGTLLYRPVARSAGEIEAGGYLVRLAGIKPTPADATCPAEGGGDWPCGAVARTQFRSWMRGRAIACDVPSKRREITTRCTLDGEDMARWLVENGWAASAGGQHDGAEAKARREKKGMFGPSPLAEGAQ